MGKSRKNKSTQRDPVPSSNIKAQVKSEEPTQNQTPTDSTPQPKVAHVQSADQDSAKRDLMSTSQLRAYRSDEASKIAQRITMRLLAILLIGFLLIYLKTLLIPLVLAILFAFLLSPSINRMTKLGIPFTLSTLIAHLFSLVAISAILFAFTATVGPLSRSLPKYRDAMITEISQGVEWVSGKFDNPKAKEALRKEIGESVLPKAIDQGVKLTQSGLSTTTTILGNFFLTLLLSIFIFMESAALKTKVSQAFGREHPLLISLSDIGLDVRAYVVAKTLTSLLTSVCVYAVLKIAEVDFPFFWAMLTFPLNFVPTVGAIVASLPPITIALIDPNLTFSTTVGVTISLGLINAFIGSVIEPNYVGQKVQLSPLVVFLSMLLWGLIWGPIGMILAIPIMVSVKVICSHIEGLKPISIMMRG
jgi:AI-2 transport protein TqsA